MVPVFPAPALCTCSIRFAITLYTWFYIVLMFRYSNSPAVPAVQIPATGMAQALLCYSHNTASVLPHLLSHHRHSDYSNRSPDTERLLLSLLPSEVLKWHPALPLHGSFLLRLCSGGTGLTGSRYFYLLLS